MRRARSRQAGDDDRPVDFDIDDFGVAADPILDAKPGAGIAQRHFEQIGAGDGGGVGVLVDGLEPDAEAFEKVGRAEIAQAGFGACCVQDAFDGQADGVARGPIEAAVASADTEPDR